MRGRYKPDHELSHIQLSRQTNQRYHSTRRTTFIARRVSSEQPAGLSHLIWQIGLGCSRTMVCVYNICMVACRQPR
jgi:hypothetical protein